MAIHSIRTGFAYRLAAVVIAACCAPALIAAENAGPRITGVRVGFDGHYKVGYWTTVVVSLAGGTETVHGRLEVIVADGDGVDAAYAAVANEMLEVPASSELSVTRYVKFGRTSGGMTVVLRGDDGVLASRTFSASEFAAPALSTSELIVTVGNDIGVSDALRWRKRRGVTQSNVIATVVDDIASLPDRWFGYEGVDTLVVTTSDSAQLARWTNDQLAALTQWVRLGGHLVLCVGVNGANAVGETDSPFAEFAPGRFESVLEQHSTAGLESYAGATQRLDEIEGLLRMTLLRDVRGRIEALERTPSDEQPTVIRFAFGLGQVMFVAIDLDQPPTSLWQARPHLVANVLERLPKRSSDNSPKQQSGKAAHLGYDDISGQLRAALDQFSGVKLIWFSGIAALLIAYVLLIGPADYFFLKGVLRRMHFTWISFPLIVVSFCVLAFVLARELRSPEIKINQVEIVDIDSQTSLIRGTMWAHVYSPATESYDLSFSPRLLEDAIEIDDVLLTWQGLPGDGLGGMDTRVTAGSYDRAYAIFSSGLDADIGAMPIQVSSSKTLTARWWGTTDLPFRSNLRVSAVDDRLHGNVTNPLPIKLSGCVVYFENWAYRLDKEALAAGETISIDGQTTEKTLDGHLTRRKVIEGKDTPTAWDRADQNVPRIVEMMLFFDAAGGSSYTELTHRYQSFTDLSPQLYLSRAVLTGYAETRAGELSRDGESLADHYDPQRQWTFYRIVLPVRK